MPRVPIDIAAELARLEALSNFELRAEWRRLHHMQPPKSLSRELLLRGITYKIQERAFGGLSKSILRKLTGTEPEASSPESRRAVPRTLIKPGTRLVREWNGDTHTVLVHADGIEWRGQRHRSLCRARNHRRALVRAAVLWSNIEEGGKRWLMPTGTPWEGHSLI